MVRQLGQSVKQTLNEHVTIMSLAKGLLVSYFITLPLFAIFAFVLTYTDFPEQFIPSSVMIITIVSILAAGSTATRNVKNKGWLNGGVVGLTYMAILYLFSSIAYSDFSVDRHVITMVAIGILAGAIGGIIGINFKRRSRSRYK